MEKIFAAMKAIILRDDRFLLVKQQLKKGVVWDLPGGRVQYGESPFETLHREVAEETGLKVEILRPAGVWWFFRAADSGQVVCSTYICRPLTEQFDVALNPDAHEQIQEGRWITKTEFSSDEYTVSHASLKALIAEQL